jgi:hypothetical protein
MPTNDPPSGASRIVPAPRTRIVHSTGAMNVLPATVVFGVSAASFSGGVSLGPGAGAGVGSAATVPLGSVGPGAGSVTEGFAGEEQAANAINAR